MVRRTGQLYEALTARRQHRQPQPLFHSALVVTSNCCPHVIEMAPVWNMTAPDRGVVLEGPVGAPMLGRWRAFRYEVRCWQRGRIPDIAQAVGSPVRVSEAPIIAAAWLTKLPELPALTWGRDELAAGDMWNSNSVIAYLLARVGFEAARIQPPGGGRAPGWNAGIELAARRRGARPNRTIAVQEQR